MTERRRPIRQLLDDRLDHPSTARFNPEHFLDEYITRALLHRAEDVLSRTLPDEIPNWGPIVRDPYTEDPVENEDLGAQIAWMQHALALDIVERLQSDHATLLLTDWSTENETYVLQCYLADYRHLFPQEEYEPEWVDEIIEAANETLQGRGSVELEAEMEEMARGGSTDLFPNNEVIVFYENGAVFAQYSLSIEELHYLVCASWGQFVRIAVDASIENLENTRGDIALMLKGAWEEVHGLVWGEEPAMALEYLWEMWMPLNRMADKNAPTLTSRFNDEWDLDVVLLFVEKCIFALNWYIRNDKDDVSRGFIKNARDVFADPFHSGICRELGIDGMVLDPPFGTPYNWDDVKDG